MAKTSSLPEIICAQTPRPLSKTHSKSGSASGPGRVSRSGVPTESQRCRICTPVDDSVEVQPSEKRTRSWPVAFVAVSTASRRSPVCGDTASSRSASQCLSRVIVDSVSELALMSGIVPQSRRAWASPSRPRPGQRSAAAPCTNPGSAHPRPRAMPGPRAAAAPASSSWAWRGKRPPPPVAMPPRQPGRWTRPFESPVRRRSLQRPPSS